MTGRAVKRLFDVVCSSWGLSCLRRSSCRGNPGKVRQQRPVFFKHERIGKDFRPFRVYKLRTMP